MIKVNNIPKNLSRIKKMSILVAADCYSEQMNSKKIFSLTEKYLHEGIDFEDLVENMKDEVRVLIFGTNKFYDIVRIEDPFKNYGYIAEEKILKVV